MAQNAGLQNASREHSDDERTARSNAGNSLGGTPLSGAPEEVTNSAQAREASSAGSGHSAAPSFTDKLRVDPSELKATASKIDEIASKLEKQTEGHLWMRDLEAAGKDEVSTTVADTLRSVATDYDYSARQGINELQKLAAALRAQSSKVQQTDQDFAKGL